MNNARTVPPFRADHAGSLLRPPLLLEAREKHARGDLSAAELREVEDRAIAGVVKLQEEVGLRSITDGEYRRTYFHIDFLEQFAGVKTDIPVTVTKPDGTEELAPPVMRVIRGNFKSTWAAQGGYEPVAEALLSEMNVDAYDEAAQFAALQQLALSPQCGFSSTAHGNNIACDAQRDKLKLVVETAAEVWGKN